MIIELPAHRELGMAISDPLLSVEEPDTFFFMRGFPDLASREPMKARFYESALWKEELEQKLMRILDHFAVVLVEGPETLFNGSESSSASILPASASTR